MSTRHDRKVLLSYVDRLIGRIGRRSVAARELSEWCETADVGFEWDAAPRLRGPRAPTTEEWRTLAARVADGLHALRRTRPDSFARNLVALGEFLRLDPAEQAVLELGARYARGGDVENLCDNMVNDGRLTTVEVITRLTTLPAAAVRRTLRPSGALVEGGLARFRKSNYFGLAVPDRLVSAMEPPSRTLDDVRHALFGTVSKPDVTWADFEHLGEARDFVLRLVSGALGTGARGVNILLYGPPGTGKTAFCKVLARQLNATLHAAGEDDGDGDEPTRTERLQQLRLCQRLLGSSRRALVLFDEMEDLLPGGLELLMGGTTSGPAKGYLNRLLETNPVPTLWTTNAVETTDPALLRRMTYALEMRPPPRHIRERVWQRMAKAHKLPIDGPTAQALAREFEDPPALAAGAVRAAALCGGDASDVRIAVQAVGKAMRGGLAAAPRPLETAPFDPALVNADDNLMRLADRLGRRAEIPAVSFCLYGPPGTGKSAYARHLADRLGLPVMQKRASDLLSMYVGGSEKRIARAFAEARQDGALLVFDEADSLLADRRGAQRSWEVTQVNEMLTWMESHPLPFVCTTNLFEGLDSAALRRFTFKIRLLPLTADQVRLAFHRFFGVDAPPASDLRGLDNLTPGDFAVVRRKADALDVRAPARLAALMREEQAAKPDTGKPIGFAV